MRQLRFAILLIFIIGCKTTDSELVGTWIEVTSNHRPEILIFDLDSKSSPYGINNGSKENYNIWGNRLTFSLLNSQWRYKIKSDTLKLFDIKNDSLSFRFVRNDSFKIQKLITNLYKVHLVEEKNTKLYRWNNYSDNTIVLTTTNVSFPELYINGKKYILDSLLYSKIYKLNTNGDVVDNLLFVDKSVKVGTLKLLEKELRKVGLRTIKYITQYDNKLEYTRVVLPPSWFNFPDSLKNKIPPPPPKPPDYRYEDDLLCQIRRNEIVLNNVVVSFDSLKNKIIHEFSIDNKPILVIYFDPSLKYKQYIHEVIRIREIYYQMMDDYAQKKYDFKNFSQRYFRHESAAHKIAKDIRDKYPMLIREEYEPI